MNGMMSGNSPLAGMTQEDLMRLLAMIQMRKQQGMMQAPMMLAQNLVDPAKMKGTGVLDEKGTYDSAPAPVADPAGYSLGKDTKQIEEHKTRQLTAPINRNDPMWKMLQSSFPKESPDKIDLRYRVMQQKTP